MTDRLYDVITFDCYGTLIDWEQGIRQAWSALRASAHVPVDPDAALAVFGEVEATVERESYRRYREVLAETARRIAARLGVSLPAARAGFLADSMAAWPPFPDTNPALRRLSDAGYRLGILSNVDDDLLAWTRRHLSASFDPVVTAEQVGSYKPAPAHFTAAQALIDGQRWLHAAQSYFHDVAPAVALRIPMAWINRKGQPPGDSARPDREFPTLTGLADWLAP
jgi:2-haloalkanoic acid dehalogenase type II